uniref:Trafficking protein particle complex subunit 2-like protein n=1 Tax=Eubosmina coregoni TaxID=186181 RepID=A0A4Y7LLU1_9CRUS|nr:EOG090X0HN8 [Eubosmina coregoni]SVE70158.1 EOG090X0HN8 [Eubosmina coregoni]
MMLIKLHIHQLFQSRKSTSKKKKKDLASTCIIMAVCIGFIGKENSPLFLRCINSDQELQFHYIVHTCLDFVEEKIVQSNKSGSELRELYLGLLYSNEEVKAYGYVTNTKIKIVIIIDSTNSLLRDNEIRALFRKLHNSYSELVSNPFYTPGDTITAK